MALMGHRKEEQTAVVLITVNTHDAGLATTFNKKITIQNLSNSLFSTNATPVLPYVPHMPCKAENVRETCSQSNGKL